MDNPFDLVAKAAAGGIPWRQALRQIAPRRRKSAGDNAFAFDRLARSLAEEVPRREALRRLGGGLATALLASLGVQTAWGQRPPCRGRLTLCNGVCVDTRTDPKHCGGCDTPCPEGTVCANGRCGSSSGGCPSGQTRCSGRCVDLRTDPDNCGACGTVCTSRNCSSGLCCATGEVNCSGKCVNLGTDPSNCLSCGNVCPSGMVCGPGGCECPMTQSPCIVAGVTVCVDTASHPDHCGGCNMPCSSNHMATRTCGSGACSGTCADGFADCNNDKRSDGCEADLRTDPNHCGACGTACSSNHMATVTCSGGECNGTCADGFADCNNDKRSDGCETNLQTDVDNCGACRKVCSAPANATPFCDRGNCGFTCNAPLTRCGDVCVNTSTDRNNCGACGNVCSFPNASAFCSGGRCVLETCNPGFGDCDGNRDNGCETDFSRGTDPNNCGGCGIVCTGGRICAGATSLARCVCPAGTTDCGAVAGCVNTNTDPNNCGACGNRCSAPANATPTCSAGQCSFTCNAPLTRCGDVCVNTSTDPSNCGACGNRCSAPANATAFCDRGTCGFTCNMGYTNCGGAAGCVNTNTDFFNCGACSKACLTGQTCTNGVCR